MYKRQGIVFPVEYSAFTHVHAVQAEGVQVGGFEQPGGGFADFELVLEGIGFRAGADASAAAVGTVLGREPTSFLGLIGQSGV